MSLPPERDICNGCPEWLKVSEHARMTYRAYLMDQLHGRQYRDASFHNYTPAAEAEGDRLLNAHLAKACPGAVPLCYRAECGSPGEPYYYPAKPKPVFSTEGASAPMGDMKGKPRAKGKPEKMRGKDGTATFSSTSTPKVLPPGTAECQNCGGLFTPTDSRHRFCNVNCRTSWNAKAKRRAARGGREAQGG